jgi:hypothetical protein
MVPEWAIHVFALDCAFASLQVYSSIICDKTIGVHVEIIIEA